MRWTAIKLRAAALGVIAPAAIAPVGASAQTAPPETVFTAIKPCRAFSTAPTGKMTGDSYRTFQIAGSGSFAGQGGAPAGCGVPFSATAVAISLTGIGSPSAGYAVAFSYGAQLPNVYTLNVQGNVANTAGTISAIAEGKMNVFVTRPMHVIGDVVGYYAPQITAEINEDGTIASSSKRVLAARFDGNYYHLTIDRNTTGCVAVGALVGSGNRFLTAMTYSDQVLVTTYFINQSFTSTQTSMPFRIVVTC
jgi:hypothetical protein